MKRRLRRKLRNRTMKISKLQQNQPGTLRKVSLILIKTIRRSRFLQKLFLISIVIGQWMRKKRMLWSMLIGHLKNSDENFEKEAAILKKLIN